MIRLKGWADVWRGVTGKNLLDGLGVINFKLHR